MTDFKNMEILIADEDEGRINILRRLISHSGFNNINIALSARQAVETIESTDTAFSLVIASCKVRDMNGPDLLEIVTRKSPISRRIMLTESQRVGTALDAVNRGGANCIISIPWDDEDLIRKIKYQLKLFEMSESQMRYFKNINLQNIKIYKAAMVLKEGNEKLRSELNEKQGKVQELESKIDSIKEARKIPEGVFQLHELISKNLLINQTSVVKAFHMFKEHLDTVMSYFARKYTLTPPSQLMERKEIFHNLETIKIERREYDSVDAVLQHIGKQIEVQLFAIGKEDLANSEFEKYNTPPDLVELLVSEGIFTDDNIEKISPDSFNDGKHSDSEICNMLIEQGIVDRIDLSGILLKKKIIEVRLRDRMIIKQFISQELLKEKDIHQMFLKQLNLFYETGTCTSVIDLLSISDKIDARTKAQLDLMSGEIQKKAEAQSTPQHPGKEIAADLIISEDKTEAYVDVLVENRPDVTVDEIKHLLKEQNILYGWVSDSLIEKFLKFSKNPDKKFLVAIGMKPVEGRNARIIYKFNYNYQRPGTILNDGTIDFKKRGEIPFVKADQLLAEKIEGEPGTPGIDIYGTQIQPEPVSDIELYAGEGTRLSEDGLKVYAEIEGQPGLDAKGAVSVRKEITVKGDVSFKTGNIDYEGNVVVTGSIREGFSVKCVDLTVKSINGADIDIKGDLNTSEGVVDSKVVVQGGIRAKYIKNSNIASLDDILITREIMESRISTSGMIINEHGRITGSVLSSRRGFNLGQVGMETAEKSILKLGVNDHLDLQLNKWNQFIEVESEKIQELEQSKKIIEDKLLRLHKHASNQSFSHEAKQRQINEMKAALSDFKGKQATRIKKMKEIKVLEKELSEFDSTVKDIFKSQDRLMEGIEKLNQNIQKHLGKIEEFVLEKAVFKDLNRLDGPPPTMIVNKKILSGSKILGCSSSMVIKDDLKQCKIVELETNNPVNPGEKKLFIQSSE